MPLYTNLTTTDLSQNLQTLITRLGKDRVLVGIPDEGATRKAKLLDPAAQMADDAVAAGVPIPKKATKMANAAKNEANVTNAELLSIHTNGSPRKGIPARPVIEPAIATKDNRDRITAQLKLGAEAELAGNHSEALTHMAKAGTLAMNASKRWFTDPRNGWAPNSPRTIERKLGKLTGARRRKALAQIAAQGGSTEGVVTPLIDTGQLRRSITYVVVDS